MPFYCGKRSAGICVRCRPEKILNVLQRIRLRFFRVCGLASARISFAS
jgi:acetolactate synthase regulatory subunit